MDITYLIPMFLAGLVLKIIDDIFDRKMFSNGIGVILSFISIPLGAWLMLDAQGFILVGSIFWTTLFRGKVDNIGFRLGYFLTGPIWIGLYMLLRPFVFTVMVVASFAVCIFSIVLTSVLHDFIKKRSSRAWDILIENRFLIVVFDLPCLALGIVGPLGIAGILLLVGGYSAGERLDNVLLKRPILRNRFIYPQIVGLENATGTSIHPTNHYDVFQSLDRPPHL
jgi:uncharacterized membrane protein